MNSNGPHGDYQAGAGGASCDGPWEQWYVYERKDVQDLPVVGGVRHEWERYKGDIDERDEFRIAALESKEFGRYLTSNERGSVEARATKIGPWEAWDIAKHDNSYVIRSCTHNRFLAAEYSGGDPGTNTKLITVEQINEAALWKLHFARTQPA